MAHEHSHDHEHGEGSELSDIDLRVRALESLLVEKGYVDPEALDVLIDTYETKIGPRNGAAVVAKAWTDPAYKERLLANGAAAIRELGFELEPYEFTVMENTDDTHNVIVCTLCSCYPRALLGMSPAWYKSSSYRARVVREPRSVLAEFGVELTDEVDVRVHDSTAELRYMVLPQRPAGTEDWPEEQLAKLITRDSLVGTQRNLETT